MARPPSPPGVPTPTPTPRPVSTEYVSPGDYAQSCYDNLCNDGDPNDTFTRKETADWFGIIKDEIQASET